MTVRVALAEDHALLREGLARIVDGEDDLQLVGTACDLSELFELVARETPDVVVTDIRMPPTGTDEGIQAARRLRADSPDVGVVLLSNYAEPGYALALLEQGSRGRAYLLKERVTDVDQLVHAIHSVASGGSVIDPTVVDLLVNRSRSDASALHRLTEREREVLREMATGKNNAAIGNSIFLTERAVEKHTNAIFSKLGLSGEHDMNRRVAAVLIFLSEAGPS